MPNVQGETHLLKTSRKGGLFQNSHKLLILNGGQGRD
jgi:hypothetical protein